MYEGQQVLDNLKLAPLSHPSENYNSYYQCNSNDDDDGEDDDEKPSQLSENSDNGHQFLLSGWMMMTI